MGITVVMSSYLGDYPGSRSNPEAKFIRAVQSFINQKHQEKELIIVSDGCEITNGLYKAYYQQNKDITLVRVEKREEAWPGELREVGRSIAKHEWITYLDSDDVILENHLSIINNKISTLYPNEGIIFNMKYGIPLLEDGNERYYKYLGMTREQLQPMLKDAKSIDRIGKIAYTKAVGKFGTWQIVHKKNLPTRWMNSEKTGEDRLFIDRLKKISKWQEFYGEYVICHVTINSKIVWEI